MKTRAAARLAVVVGFTCASVAAQQAPLVTSVTVRVAAVPISTATIVVENHATVPLVAWKIYLRSAHSTFASNFTDSSFPYGSGSGPVPPGERRVVQLDLRGPADVTTAKLTLAAFANGNLEGDQQAVDDASAQRSQIVAALRYWAPILKMTPQDDALLKTYLQSHVEENARMMTDDPSGTRPFLVGLLTGPRRPRGWMGLVVATRGDEIAKRLAALTVPGAIVSVGPVKSASIEARASTGAKVVAYIENLRGVPVEAWRIELAHSDAPGNAFGSHGVDSPSDPSRPVQPGSGPLQPREVREMFISGPEEASAPLPHAFVSLAMFAGGTFEGSADYRDQVLKDRAGHAQDLAYWIQALKDLAGTPASAASSTLRGLVRQRQQAGALAQRTDSAARDVAKLADDIDRAPDRQAAMIASQIARMDHQRQVLLRSPARVVRASPTWRAESQS